MPTVTQVFQSKKLWAWFNDTPCDLCYFNGTTEKGEDFGRAFGEPVGVPVAGRIVRIVHWNNAINDVVELQDSTGAVWLYQHITAKVKLGDVLLCGSVIGTENGTPIDNVYSTGTHIEVRYCPAGKWSPGIDSWYEPWIDPRTIFASIGGQPAGTAAPGPLAGIIGRMSANATAPPAISLSPNADVTNVLWVLDDLFIFHSILPEKPPTFHVGIGVGFDAPDPIQYAIDVFDNIQLNFRTLWLRIIFGGLGIFLLYKVSSTWIDYGAIAQTATGIAQTAVKGAVMLA